MIDLNYWLVFVVLLLTTLVFLSQLCNISSHSEDLISFLVFKLVFTCLLLLFYIVFSNVSGYSTRMEILLYLVSTCPPKQVLNSFSHIQFLGLH